MQPMKPINTWQSQAARNPIPRSTALDPAPTRMEYKVQRLWLTPLIRAIVRKGVPAFALGFFALAYFSDQDNVQSLNTAMMSARQTVETRPEYAISTLQFEGASAALQAELQAELETDLPASTLTFDLDGVRAELEAMPAVESTILRVLPGGVLSVAVQEVPPTLLWRSGNDLILLTKDGTALRNATARRDYPDLPLVAGLGADAHTAEALAIYTEARPLHGALRGLVRVGDRRWDLVLAGDQKIALPEENPIQALRQILVLAQTKDLLRRDVTLVDYRAPRRPTVRLSTGAMEVVRTQQPAAENRNN